MWPTQDPKTGQTKLVNNYDLMDDHNKEATDVMASKGLDAAFDFMTKGLKDGTMSYSEMRSRWG